jgi:hypothetical protein
MNAETSFRLTVERLTASNTRWVFYVLDQDDRNWSGDPKETFATRREGINAGEGFLQRLLNMPTEKLALRFDQLNRQAIAGLHSGQD